MSWSSLCSACMCKVVIKEETKWKGKRNLPSFLLPKSGRFFLKICSSSQVVDLKIKETFWIKSTASCWLPIFLHAEKIANASYHYHPEVNLFCRIKCKKGEKEEASKYYILCWVLLWTLPAGVIHVCQASWLSVLRNSHATVEREAFSHILAGA